MAVKIRQTISNELFDLWNRCKKRGDITALINFTGKSEPVIVQALRYGCVLQDGLADKITEFFTDRLAKETSKTEQLKTLLDEKSA